MLHEVPAHHVVLVAHVGGEQLPGVLDAAGREDEVTGRDRALLAGEVAGLDRPQRVAVCRAGQPDHAGVEQHDHLGAVAQPLGVVRAEVQLRAQSVVGQLELGALRASAMRRRRQLEHGRCLFEIRLEVGPVDRPATAVHPGAFDEVDRVERTGDAAPPAAAAAEHPHPHVLQLPVRRAGRPVDQHPLVAHRGTKPPGFKDSDLQTTLGQPGRDAQSGRSGTDDADVEGPGNRPGLAAPVDDHNQASHALGAPPS